MHSVLITHRSRKRESLFVFSREWEKEKERGTYAEDSRKEGKEQKREEMEDFGTRKREISEKVR